MIAPCDGTSIRHFRPSTLKLLYEKKAARLPGTALESFVRTKGAYFFAARFSMIAAWAAARRATGTR